MLQEVVSSEVRGTTNAVTYFLSSNTRGSSSSAVGDVASSLLYSTQGQQSQVFVSTACKRPYPALSLVFLLLVVVGLGILILVLVVLFVVVLLVLLLVSFFLFLLFLLLLLVFLLDAGDFLVELLLLARLDGCLVDLGRAEARVFEVAWADVEPVL
jgi:hypothetical protein